MGRRMLGALAVVAAVAALLSATAAGQAAARGRANTKPWTPPRTPDGQPDLTGYWTNSTFTPLERPVNLAGKPFFTDAEAAAFERQRRLQQNSQAEDDVHYDNVIWQTEKHYERVASKRTSLIVDPPDGRIPALTPQAQQQAPARAEAARRRGLAESAQARSLAERCIAWGAEGPPMLGATYNANLQIVQNRDSVVVLHEMIHAARIVPLDGRPHLGGDIRQLAGDSRGRWEGHTLVVDTTNFTDRTPFRGPPSTARQDIFTSEALHVVERFTRVDADTILYQFTVDDPRTWTKPWSGELPLRKWEGPIFEYACHEGNYGLRNILTAARVQERATGQERAGTR